MNLDVQRALAICSSVTCWLSDTGSKGWPGMCRKQTMFALGKTGVKITREIGAVIEMEGASAATLGA